MISFYNIYRKGKTTETKTSSMVGWDGINNRHRETFGIVEYTLKLD